MKAASADPLVWAMKSVDDKFPDSREKDAETIKAEAQVEMKMGPAVLAEEAEAARNDVTATKVDDEEYDDDYDEDYDDDVLDDSDILDDESEMLDTKMIDELAASKKKKETKEKPVVKSVPEPARENSVEIKAEDKLVMSTDGGAVTMEVTPMRQNVSNVPLEEVRKAPKEEIVQPEPKKKVPKFSKTKLNLDFKQKKLMIGFAVLLVIAVAGVCFGVIATVKQGKAMEELAEQAQMATTKDETEVDGEYINLKDWKIKIKIIAGLDNVSYNMITNDYAEVQIWGSKQDKSANYVPSFAKQNKNATPLGTMVRVPRYERAAAGRLIWYDDYYNYYYQGPSGVPSVSEDEMSWWVESYLLVKEMLTNADNYTTM